MPSPTTDKNNNKDYDGTQKYVLPPFVKETVNFTIAYKVGNTKTWKKQYGTTVTFQIIAMVCVGTNTRPPIVNRVYIICDPTRH